MSWCFGLLLVPLMLFLWFPDVCAPCNGPEEQMCTLWASAALAALLLLPLHIRLTLHALLLRAGKDRKDPAKQLHTSFKLQASGEQLALLRPDRSVASVLPAALPK
jgi:hypothetical protein